MVPRTLPRGSRARDLVARVSDSACVFSVACVRICHGDTTCRYCTPRVAGFIFRFQSFFHENTRVPPFHWWVPDFRSQPSAASLLRKFQSLPSPPPPLWHPAYADSSASRQTARWTHVNKGLQASMSSASTSSSYCLKNEVYKIKSSPRSGDPTRRRGAAAPWCRTAPTHRRSSLPSPQPDRSW